MSTYLTSLLGATEPLFSLSIKQLESASGRPGADVKLISDIIQKVHQKTKQLGLDPQDTTGEELYRALLNKIQQDDERLAHKIGGNNPSNVEEMLPIIVRTVENFLMPRSAWVMKKSVAKKLLHDSPPKNVMKLLGHSSVDSMLKRENVSEIFAALRFAESPAWFSRFTKSYKILTASDFETRPIEILLLSKKRWGKIAENYVRQNKHNVTHLKELGVVAVLPFMPESMPGVTLLVLPLVFHYINEIRVYSTFFKLQQVKPNFGKIVAETLVGDAHKTALMAGTHVHWRVIQRFYGASDQKDHPEEFEPHLQPEDLVWRKAEEYLYDLDSELEFWRGLDYVGVESDKNPVSFNLIDVSMSYGTQASYNQRLCKHMRGNLWNELFVRYMGEANMASQVLRQLDTTMVAPERLKV